MRDRILYLGPFNNKRQKELIDKSIKSLKDNNGQEFYYLLPNGELLQKYRQYFINNVENVFEINLFTFDNIVNEILKETKIETIDNPIKNLIIGRVLENLLSENKLSYYKDVSRTQGFTHSLNDIIGEIKRSLVYPEDYLRKCSNRTKFKEIGLIYKEYEEVLRKFNLQDREGTYFKSVEILRKNNFLEDLNFIIIDEFYDFRPIELAILKELVKKDLDIYINMPFDMEVRSSITDKTVNILKELGFTIEYIDKENRGLFEEIGSRLFSDNECIYSSKENIQIINAPTDYLELRRVFEEIKTLHSTGTNLEDIGVVITNPDYLSALYKLSDEEQIPINIDKIEGLRNLKLTGEILGIIKNRINNGNKFNLINRIKFVYFNIFENGKRDLYELILRKLNFKDIDDLKDLLDSGTSINISQENLKDLQDIIKIVENEIESIPEKDTIANYNQYILNKLEEFKINEKILHIYKETKDEKLLLKNLSGLNKIKEILSSIEILPLFEGEISLKQYYLILEEYLEEETIIEEGNIKGVSVLNPINSRGILKDVIFITGLSQGSYPPLQKSNYFLNEENYRELKTIGIDTKSYMERLSNESLKFASIISSCRDRLYLSYNRGHGDIGLPSMFLDNLLELFVDSEDINIEHVGLKYLIKKDITNITNVKDFTRYLLYDFYNNKNLDSNGYNIYENLDKNILNSLEGKVEGEFYRNKESFNKYNGLLEEDKILKDVNVNINNVFSISYLESYSRCPYAFMLNRLFGIETMERDWEEDRPMDIGTIYHEALRHYYEYYLEEIKGYILEEKEFNIGETTDYLRKIVDEYAKQYEFDLELRKDLLIVENIISRLKDFIEEDIKRLYKHKLLPYKFEVDFGNEPKFYIENEERKIPIIGRIDRIDKFVNQDKYVLVDYKSSGYGIRDIDDMKIGLSLQLPVYIMSQKDKDVLVGAYGIINNGKLEIKLGLVEETSMITKRNKGALAKEDWKELMNITKENIFEIIDNINKGNFSVDPLECSKYCPYKYICRYEDAMEDE